MNLLHSVDPEELNTLRARWGNVPLEEAALRVAHPFLTGDHQMLVSGLRRAQSC